MHDAVELKLITLDYSYFN